MFQYISLPIRWIVGYFKPIKEMAFYVDGIACTKFYWPIKTDVIHFENDQAKIFISPVLNVGKSSSLRQEIRDMIRLYRMMEGSKASLHVNIAVFRKNSKLFGVLRSREKLKPCILSPEPTSSV